MGQSTRLRPITLPFTTTLAPPLRMIHLAKIGRGCKDVMLLDALAEITVPPAMVPTTGSMYWKSGKSLSST